jgi:hypothetical protein
MKKYIEVSGEGFDGLLGETVTIFCAIYIYTGKLVGVNTEFILLENPSIVYETGPFTDNKWKDAQALPNNLYIQKGMIESFGIVKT